MCECVPFAKCFCCILVKFADLLGILHSTKTTYSGSREFCGASYFRSYGSKSSALNGVHEQETLSELLQSSQLSNVYYVGACL